MIDSEKDISEMNMEELLFYVLRNPWYISDSYYNYVREEIESRAEELREV